MSLRCLAILCPGTWEFDPAGDPKSTAPRGLLALLADQLDPAVWDVIFVSDEDYPKSFGGVAGGPNVSYVDSVKQGAKNAFQKYYQRLRGRYDYIAIEGFSQGEEMAARLMEEIVRAYGGRDKVRWYGGFGPPTRPRGRTYNQGGSLLYEGISDYRQPLVEGIEYGWFCFPTDIYGNSNPDSYNTIGYKFGTNWSLSPKMFLDQMNWMLQTNQLQQLFLASTQENYDDNRIDIPGLETGFGASIGTILTKLGTSAIGSVAGGIPILGGLFSKVDVPGLFFKAINTTNQLIQSANASHNWYGDPAHPLAGTRTAIDHHARYLNYVGVNGPIQG